MRSGCPYLLEVLGISIFRCDQTEFVRGKIANGIAVHRKLGCAGGGDDLETRLFKIDENLRPDGLDLRHDVIRPMPFHGFAKLRSIQHREHFTRVGHLHCGRMIIRIAGDDPRPEPLGRYHELAAEFAGAEEQYLRDMAQAASSVSSNP